MAKRPAPAKSSPAKKSTKPVISILGIGQMGLVCAGLLAAPDKPRWDDSDAPPPPSPKNPCFHGYSVILPVSG